MKSSAKAMLIASQMSKLGYSRADAMIKAWSLVKKKPIETKVSGVTYEKRQKAIEHLTRYPSNNIGISLEREKTNLYDANAVAVMASVTGRGSYCMGYLPKPLASIVAPIMDRGESVISSLKQISGGYSNSAKYGLVIDVTI